ncbi:MAG: hypothetical protein K9L22_02925 [Methylococcaceae bacterium]|nr:hypothetical protein [Methylococcaceae bacterium]
MILAKNLKNRGVIINPDNNDPKEQVSVDLSVGNLYQKSGDVNWRTITDSITINPSTCILIQTNEVLKMPNNVFGLLCTKGSIGAKGIIIANTKLDPLFDGNLNIPVYNVGNKKVTLQKGSKFCSISFWVTEQPIIGSSTRNAIRIQPREGSWISDFLSNNTPHIITGLVSVLSAIAAAIITVNYGGS